MTEVPDVAFPSHDEKQLEEHRTEWPDSRRR